MKNPTHRIAAMVASVTLLAASCGGSNEPETASSEPDAAESSDNATADAAAAGIRLVSAQDGAAIQDDPPADLVILDVRTPEEFAEGHLEGAVILDFYREDFADQLAELDPDVPYLLYCRSGNRSGQTAEMMEQLGFVDVADVDGGIVSWTEAELPVIVE